jgi:hypothetical protein
MPFRRLCEREREKGINKEQRPDNEKTEQGRGDTLHVYDTERSLNTKVYGVYRTEF